MSTLSTSQPDLRSRARGRAATRRIPEVLAFAFIATLLGAGCSPTYPKCEEDGDCKQGEFCVNQLCQQCRTDADCSTGQACNAGACENIVGYCDDSVACPSGQECLGNRCQSPKPEPIASEPVSNNGACQLQTVYFGYDSANLEGSARDAIAKNAQCVREKSMKGVRVTGHTDNRGTEEYNLALGDRRAKSVEQYMNSLGVERGSLSTSSMGEEAARGEDESAMSQDRRVEFTAR